MSCEQVNGEDGTHCIEAAYYWSHYEENIKLQNNLWFPKITRNFQGDTKVGVVYYLRLFDADQAMLTVKFPASMLNYVFHEMLFVCLVYEVFKSPIGIAVREGSHCYYMRINHYTGDIVNFSMSSLWFFSNLTVK